MTRPTILTVDDDRSVLAAVEHDLRDRYGDDHRIVGAASGDEALETLRELKLRGDPVALLLVDQRMPGMTGVEFIRAAQELYPDAKRALLTAYADTEAAIRAINDAGVDHYLLKPWDPPEERLYPVLDDLLGTWRPPPPQAEVRVIGQRWSRTSHEVRQFLARNLVPYRWVDATEDDAATELLDLAGRDASELPVVVLGDGSVLVRPDVATLAECIGLRTRAERDAYDLVVVGAGPAGLAAGVYGASEGLSTLILEHEAPGGQAGTSSRIENYLGFPRGLSGADLTSRARQQAARFGAEILTPQAVSEVRRSDGYLVVACEGGGELSASALVIASGVAYRTLDVPGVAELTGAGIYYSAGRAEALDHTDGSVYLLGGGNSAGQAAMFLSTTARDVTIVIRAPSLDATMSRYLIDQIDATDNITVRTLTGIDGAAGDGHLQELTLRSVETGEEERVPADALFIFIGMAPRTGWLGDLVLRDDRGFVLTGVDLGPSPRGWPYDDPPLPLETNVPGVFAAGDVRHGSVKRVASAVGEGAMAVRFAHDHLARP